jgi:ubiquinone/menaquinone biosynthesis C-methylase UbiE
MEAHFGQTPKFMADRGRASIFDRRWVPALYDLDVRLCSRSIWGASVASQARLLADLVTAGLVLDVPAGTGLFTGKALAGRPGGPLIVAVDLSGQMLRRARRRLGDRAVYVEADVAQLPFREGAFPAAHSANGFHLFPSPSLAAQELARVTRPGGRVVVTTWTDRGHLLARSYQRLLARLGHVETPRSPTDYVATIEAAGLLTDAHTVTGTLLQWKGTRTP